MGKGYCDVIELDQGSPLGRECRYFIEQVVEEDESQLHVHDCLKSGFYRHRRQRHGRREGLDGGRNASGDGYQASDRRCDAERVCHGDTDEGS